MMYDFIALIYSHGFQITYSSIQIHILPYYLIQDLEFLAEPPLYLHHSSIHLLDMLGDLQLLELYIPLELVANRKQAI
jgi:hypothetical protein